MMERARRAAARLHEELEAKARRIVVAAFRAGR